MFHSSPALAKAMTVPLITVIGSLNTDLITRSTRLPLAGETVISQSFDTGSGGKGANQAVACARLSRRKDGVKGDVAVKMMGAVGDDLFGKDLVAGLESNGIDTTGVSVKKGEKSGVACIIVDEESGENRILMSPNANFSLKPSEFSTLPAPLPNLIVLQLEIPLDTTLSILKIAKDQDVDVLLNPAPALELPEVAYKAVDHLVVNESEAAIVSKTKSTGVDWRRWGKHTERLISLGVQHITITLGAQGVVYLDTREKKMQLFAAKKVKVKDTTAAGDTFVGAYAVAVTKADRKSRTFQEMAAAVQWANQAAAKTVERQGAQSAIPWLDEIPPFTNQIDGTAVSFEEWQRT